MKRLSIFYSFFLSVSAVLCAMEKTKPLSSFNHSSAWVLPIATYKNQHGQAVQYVLLGEEAYGKDKETWDAFGGGRNNNDSNHPVSTASREFYEEAILNKTLGLTQEDVKNYIDLNNRHIQHTQWIFAVNRKRSKSVLYITKFRADEMDKIVNSFHHAKREAKFCQKEKSDIALVPFTALQEAIKNSHGSVGVTVTFFDNRSQKQRTIKLRPILVKLLTGFCRDYKYEEGKSPKIRFY